MIRKFQKKKEKKQRRETRESRGHEPDLNERMRKGPKGWDTNELRRRRLIDANRHHPEQKRTKKKTHINTKKRGTKDFLKNTSWAWIINGGKPYVYIYRNINKYYLQGGRRRGHSLSHRLRAKTKKNERMKEREWGLPVKGCRQSGLKRVCWTCRSRTERKTHRRTRRTTALAWPASATAERRWKTNETDGQ